MDGKVKITESFRSKSDLHEMIPCLLGDTFARMLSNSLSNCLFHRA